MRVAFRVDASLQIGTGHVMRCLTLADSLSQRGARCIFISREHTGHLNEYVHSRGYHVEALSAAAHGSCMSNGLLDKSLHANWLGSTQEHDAGMCVPILREFRPHWLVVDHYALDSRWEMALRGRYERLMAIDDLADRTHMCDLLLDQNLGRAESDYQGLVLDDCQRLIGPQYALLRPEFAELRAYSLARRKRPRLRRLLVTMGGGNTQNVTCEVLEALRATALPADCEVSVIMGAGAPHLQSVRALVNELPWTAEVSVGVTDMAHRMADSDLCIGAAGGTSWERCCMGLPTILTVLAANQEHGARALQNVGAAVYIDMGNMQNSLPAIIRNISCAERLRAASLQAQAVVDGQGVNRVASAMWAYGASNEF